MKRLSILLLAGLIPTALFSQTTPGKFQLNGDVKQVRPALSRIVVSYSYNGKPVRDTLLVTEGVFTLSGEVAEPVLLNLRALSTPGIQNERDMAQVFIQPGKMEAVSIDSFSNIKVKGSAAHTDYEQLKSVSKGYEKNLRALIDEYIRLDKAGDNKGKEKIELQIDSLQLRMNEEVYGVYARTNPSGPLSLYALRQYAGYDIDPAKVEPLFKQLPSTLRESFSGKAFEERIGIAKMTSLGNIAPDFEQADTTGKPVRLSCLRGKVLLVDFWASWCGPCRKENPNVVKAFDRFQEKGFYVLGISLDRPDGKQKWLKAIHDDQLSWAHVSDLKFWDNAVAKQYGIHAIPQNLLVDKDGMIIAKNLKGEALQKKLEELFGAGQ